MNNAAKLGAGVAGGYLLGRTKKLKMAVGLGAWLIGKKLDLSPSQPAMQGLGQLRESPQFGELSERLRGEVGGAGKRALAAAATSRMESLADRMADRNDRLTGEADEDYDDDEEKGPVDEADDQDYDDEDEEDEDRPVDEAEDDYDDEDEEDEDRPVDEADDEDYDDEEDDDRPVDEAEDDYDDEDEEDDEDRPVDEADDEDYDDEEDEAGRDDEMSRDEAYHTTPKD